MKQIAIIFTIMLLALPIFAADPGDYKVSIGKRFILVAILYAIIGMTLGLIMGMKQDFSLMHLNHLSSDILAVKPFFKFNLPD